MDKSITQMFDIKQKNIKEARTETALQIQLGQSLNLSVQVLGKESLNEKELDKWVDYFFNYLDKKRKIVLDQNEKMFAENPVPTVEQWEDMTEVQQKLYKDKQLESNRKKYQTNRAKGFLRPHKGITTMQKIIAQSRDGEDVDYSPADEGEAPRGEK